MHRWPLQTKINTYGNKCISQGEHEARVAICFAVIPTSNGSRHKLNLFQSCMYTFNRHTYVVILKNPSDMWKLYPDIVSSNTHANVLSSQLDETVELIYNAYRDGQSTYSFTPLGRSRMENVTYLDIIIDAMTGGVPEIKRDMFQLSLARLLLKELSLSARNCRSKRLSLSVSPLVQVQAGSGGRCMQPLDNR